MYITKCRDSMFELLSDSSGRILKFDLETRETQVTGYSGLSGRGAFFSPSPFWKFFFSWIGENKWFLEENQKMFG